MVESKIALGIWSWGVGAAGSDQVFGNHNTESEIEFAAAATGVDTRGGWGRPMA